MVALIEGRLVSTNTTCCLLSSAFVSVALSVFRGVPSIWASESGTVRYDMTLFLALALLT